MRSWRQVLVVVVLLTLCCCCARSPETKSPLFLLTLSLSLPLSPLSLTHLSLSLSLSGTIFLNWDRTLNTKGVGTHPRVEGFPVHPPYLPSATHCTRSPATLLHNICCSSHMLIHVYVIGGTQSKLYDQA